jgi:hypothetical protein
MSSGLDGQLDAGLLRRCGVPLASRRVVGERAYVTFVLTQEAGQIVVKRWRRDECEDAEAVANLRREPNWMAYRVSVGYEVTSDLRRAGVVGLLCNEALIKLNVRTFEEGVRTTTADATAPCERTP